MKEQFEEKDGEVDELRKMHEVKGFYERLERSLGGESGHEVKDFFDFDKCPVHIVETEDQIDALVESLCSLENNGDPPIIAVDIEACPRGPRSYEGFISLIQITHIQNSLLQTSIIDCLSLNAINLDLVAKGLGQRVLENPSILKVMHSCRSGDIGWMQRDFGI